MTTDPDWKKLTHAYGKAKDVPDLLAALTAPEPAARAAARGRLVAALAHQGTLYPASAPALAAIRALAADPATPDRAPLFELVATLVTGDPERFWTSGYPPAPEEMEAPALAPWRATLAEGEAAVPDIVKAIDDADPHVRTAAAFASAWLASKAGVLMPALRARLAREGDPSARASQVLALAYLVQLAAGAPPPELQLAGGGLVGLAAAIARAHAGVGTASDLARLSAVLLAEPEAPTEHDIHGRIARLHAELGLAAPDAAARPAYELAGWGDLVSLAFVHLDAFLDSDREQVVETWLRLVEGRTRFADRAGRPAFAFVFGMDRTVDRRRLAPDQKRLLAAFVAPETPDPRALGGLASVGLPKDLAALRALADVSPVDRWQRTFTIGERTLPGRDFLAEVPIPIDLAAALPPSDALALALQWASAEGKHDVTVAALIDKIIDHNRHDLGALLAAVEAQAQQIIRHGVPREARGGHVVMHMSALAALVTVATRVVQAGITPGRWFEALIARLADHAFVQPAVAPALAALPLERREAVVVYACAFMDSARLQAWAALAPTPTTMTRVFERLASMDASSTFRAGLDAGLAAFGPGAIPLIVAIGQRPTTNHKAVFAAALGLLGATDEAAALEASAPPRAAPRPKSRSKPKRR